MLSPNDFTHNPYVLVVLITWDLVWRGLALWKSAGRKQKYWFIALLIVNSVGTLPIVYLLISKYSHKKDKLL